MKKKYDSLFDATAYWATKPYCTVCKKHKVKNGTICHECKESIRVERTQDEVPIPLNVKSLKSSSEIAPVTIGNSIKIISDLVHNKIIRLFTYLEKALSLDDTIIRNFKSSIIRPSFLVVGRLSSRLGQPIYSPV